MKTVPYTAPAFLFATWFLVFFPANQLTGQKHDRRPNIVLIVADDLGWTGLGGYGSDMHKTPVLDQFARESVKFTNAYSAASVCTPTRASIMTGKYPARLHMTTWHENAGAPEPNDEHALLAPETVGNLPLEEITLAEALKAAGYFTAHIGKWHLGDADYYPETQGFDMNIGGTLWGMPVTYWYPFSGWRASSGELRYVPGLEDLDGQNEGAYLTDRLTDKALEVIEAKRDVPFFLNMWYYTPHVPVEGKPELASRFLNKEGEYHTNAEYAAMIASLDENVGRVLNKIKQVGLEDNTIVIFFSDNGGVIGERVNAENNYPLRSGKGSLYEGGIRVPLIVRWPGVTPPGAVSDAPVSSIDFYPTILEMTGIQMEADQTGKMDGISLTPVLRDPNSKLPRDALYWHFPHYYPTTAPVGAVREGQWKLLHYFEDNTLELYDLHTDQGERDNLAGKMPERTRELYDELKDWRILVGARLPVSNPEYRPAK